MYMLTNTKIENKYSNNSSKIQVTFQNSVVDLATIVCLWHFPGQNTGVGCHFLLQGIFPTQGLNPGLLHWRQILHHLNHTVLMHETSMCVLSHFSCVQLCETLWTVARQTPLPMGVLQARI